MVNVKFYLSDLHACGHVRGEAIAREVNKSKAGVVMDCKSDMLYSDIYAADVMVFQRAFTAGALAKMREAKAKGIKTIYETDDAVLRTPKDFWRAHSHYEKKEVRDMVKSLIAEADAITVSTHELAEAVNEFATGPTYIVENALDVDRWEGAHMKRKQTTDDSVVIGWMASESHTLDAPLISQALKRIMTDYPNTRLHSVGWVNDDQFKWVHQFHGRTKLEPWVGIHELPYHMNDFDIGVAPLVDNLFNQAKSGPKSLAVLGDVGPLRGNTFTLLRAMGFR